MERCESRAASNNQKRCGFVSRKKDPIHRKQSRCDATRRDATHLSHALEGTRVQFSSYTNVVLGETNTSRNNYHNERHVPGAAYFREIERGREFLI